ncbi:MAG: ParB/RepB/Spo0J family partition protein, partial [Erysipelotrichaceae bacterium]|nr:ParB/RepB/Spo0J family partition protein [Erysipelotrichaceae bacterium]
MAKEKTNKALGRGLSSIFGEDVENLIQSIENSGNDKPSTEISIAEIRPNPYQPRKNFDEKALKELAASIEEHGVFTPILIRRAIQGYEIIAGERRWRA